MNISTAWTHEIDGSANYLRTDMATCRLARVRAERKQKEEAGNGQMTTHRPNENWAS